MAVRRDRGNFTLELVGMPLLLRYAFAIVSCWQEESQAKDLEERLKAPRAGTGRDAERAANGSTDERLYIPRPSQTIQQVHPNLYTIYLHWGWLKRGQCRHILCIHHRFGYIHVDLGHTWGMVDMCIYIYNYSSPMDGVGWIIWLHSAFRLSGVRV